MTKFYTFPCGCQFEILQELPNGELRIKFDPHIDKLPLDCERTWNLLCAGDTKGVFQLESQLGKSMSKRVAPRKIPELAALIATMRPGCMEAMSEGKSITNHYIDRKHGREEISYYHPILEKSLKSTNGLLIFQEQAIQICRDVANFTELEAEGLRKACGKKLTAEMAKVKALFLQKAKEANKVTDEEAAEIFGWIQSSQRYSFNLCLGEETTVEAFRGTLSIKDVQPDDCVYSRNGWIKVLSKTSNYDLKDVYRCTFRCMKPGFTELDRDVYCTIDHKFECTDYVKRSIKELGQDYENSVVFGVYGNMKLISIEYRGLQNTYDIEVDDPSHVFYANGISCSNSHSVAYAHNSFVSAYCKAHFPRPFFTSYLYYSKEKMKPTDEIKELVNNAKSIGINVKVPDLRLITDGAASHFMLREKEIYAGFSDIKGVGETEIKRLVKNITAIEERLNQPFKNWTWLEMLFHCLPLTRSTVVKALIQCGCLDYFNMSRTRMLYEYDMLANLTEKELAWLNNNCNTNTTPNIIGNAHQTLILLLTRLLMSGKGKGAGIANKNRVSAIESIINALENPPYSMEDSPAWIAGIEESLLGIPMTCTKIEGRDIGSANCTCKEFLDGKSGYVLLAVEITNIKEYLTKNGKNPGSKMAFITASDNSTALDNIVAFPEVWAEAKGCLLTGNMVLIGGERGKENSLIVKNVYQL